jgi:hypothetical protein
MIKNLQSLTAIILLAFSALPVFSQWTQRQTLPAMPRTFATGFTVSNTIYVMCGYDANSTLFNDVWAYDPATDTWSQKGNFPGGNRSASTAFTIGNKAYMGTGTDGNNYLHDFWEYEPTTDVWTQKADFPGNEREEAVSFSIDSKGYLGTGQTFTAGPNSSFTTTYNDFFEYDPATDSWSLKDSFPGAPRAYAIGAVVGNKGYIGLGGNNDQTISYTDFYEYDPVTDNWTSKASMGGSGRADAGVFANGNNIYVIGGINFPAFISFSSCRKYDVVTDTWINGPLFNGGAVIAPIMQSVNGRIFAGTGFTSGLVPRNDWWEFTSLSGLSETALVEEPLAFPNPFSNELKLNLKNNSEELRIEIVDVHGNVVYRAQQKNADPETRKIDTGNLSDGTYLLRITNSSGEVTASKKIIKS